jgi:hypothetical protein
MLGAAQTAQLAGWWNQVPTRTAKTILNSDVAQSILGGAGTFGTATVTTSVVKFGTGSLDLNGSDDFIWLSSSNNSSFTTSGDFTLECWAYPTTQTSYRVIVSNWNPGILWSFLSNDQIVVYLNGSLIVNATGLTISANTWHHVALTRSGSSVQVWLDGAQAGSTGTLSGTVTWTDWTGIGCNTNDYPTSNVGSYFAGNIDEIRFSNIARYTAPFTPPTSAFTNDAYTLLLIHADGTNGQTTFSDDNS